MYKNTVVSCPISSSSVPYTQLLRCGCMLSCGVMSRVFATPLTVDCKLPLSIFQARIMEWVVISSSRETSWPRDWNCISYISCIAADSLPLSHQESPLRCVCMCIHTYVCMCIYVYIYNIYICFFIDITQVLWMNSACWLVVFTLEQTGGQLPLLSCSPKDQYL